ncbi:MAG: NTP transferase domain-containing protein [Methanosarcinaceae archaeon]|nr:NTP transferase domain-containing protein [Methanosarcinaceae archaeon]
MDSVVMAGGLGRRLGMGEKPCIELMGKYLVTYVIDALDKAEHIDRIFVAVSPATPNTETVVLNHYGGRIKVIRTPGGNYVGDMVHAVETAGILKPVLIIMSDLPLITSELIDLIIDEYQKCGTPALSVHVPISVCRSLGIRPDTVFHRNGKLIVPTGVNILDGHDIHKEQEDFNLVLENPELALNINTVNELAHCKQLLEVV